MRAILLYDFKGEAATRVEDFCREAERRYPAFKPESVSTESQEGAKLAATYDITQYPAIMIAKDDGQLIQMWQGNSLPKIDDVIGYLVG